MDDKLTFALVEVEAFRHTATASVWEVRGPEIWILDV